MSSEELRKLLLKNPNGLSASAIKQVNPELLKAPLDELEDKGCVKGIYRHIDGVNGTGVKGRWVYIYKLIKNSSLK